MSEDRIERLLPESIGPEAHLEKTALMETQNVFRERTTAAVMAVAGAAAAIACLPGSSAVLIEWLRKGGVWLAAPFCAISLVYAWIFCKRCARLSALGLRRSKGATAYLVWQAAGAFISFAVIATICTALDWRMKDPVIGILPGYFLAAWVGWRLNQIPTWDIAQREERQTLGINDDQDNG